MLSAAVTQTWTNDQENRYQQLAENLRNNPKHTPNMDECNLIGELIDCYINSQERIHIDNILKLHNILLDSVIQENNRDAKAVLKQIQNFNDFPYAMAFESLINNRVDEARKKAGIRFEEFKLQVKKHSISVDNLMMLSPLRDQFIVEPPSYYHPPRDERGEDYLLSYPKLIDYHLSKGNKNAYELAKQDDSFKNAINDLTNTMQKYSLLAKLTNLNWIYRGEPEVLRYLPHLFFSAMGSVVVALPQKVGEHTLPHPFLLDIYKADYRPTEEQEWGKYAVLGPIIGSDLLRQYPEFKDWVIFQKVLGKDIGFIAESPDKQKRVYFKCTNNMLQELFCANLLNHLGIKMAETSLYTSDKNICFLATKNLNRAYEKSSEHKNKFFTVIATDKKAKENSDDNVKNVSFAKLLIAGVALGLSDLGAHGGNAGWMTSSSNKKTSTKMGLVDYQFHPIPLSQINSIEELHQFIKKQYTSSYAFAPFLPFLMVDHVKTALEKMLEPRVYEKSKEGYYVTKGKDRSTFQEAIEKAYGETMSEFQKHQLMDVLGENGKKKLDAHKKIIGDNLASLKALLQPSVKPNPSK